MRTLGLALGGGAARGFAHIGILQAFEADGVSVDYLAGTSAGALVGTLYASGMALQEITELALRLKWRQIVSFQPTLRSVVSPHKLLDILETHCPSKRFEDLHIPLSILAADFETGEGRPFTSGPLFPPLLASCSIPFIFPPVKLNGRYYVDGGFASIVPVGTVKQMGAEMVVACDVNYNAPHLRKPGNFISMLIHFIMLVARKNSTVSKTLADLVIDVDMQGINLTDFHKAAELIERGRQATTAILPLVREKLRETV